MESLVSARGIAAPLLRINVDTDQIIPGPEIMRSTDESYARWGPGLFANWRYLADRRPNPDFILNREPWNTATILLAAPNICRGSSPEPSPHQLPGLLVRAALG